MTAPSLDTLMRWIAHYAEDTATLHKIETTKPYDRERAELFRRTVDRRHNEVRAGIKDLLAGDPGLHMRIADTVQREFEDSLTGSGTITDASYLGERVAHALCAEVPEIQRAIR